MKRILVLDGGGVKGIMQAEVLNRIEKDIGKSADKIFDLIIGTSTGAILGGLLASGKMSAKESLHLMNATLPKIFSKRLFRIPKYSRKIFVDTFSKHIGSSFTMNSCCTKYVCTSVNMVDGITHYFKSWEEKDGKLHLLEAINRSYAAPVYFGTIIDKKKESVWLDGGTGIANCPLLEALIEAFRQKWIKDEKVHILSIGTGKTNYSLSFKKASKARFLRQLLFFISPRDGGLARNQSIESRIENLRSLSSNLENLTFQRIDINMPKKYDKLDGIKYISYYKQLGIKMAKLVDLAPLEQS